MRLLQAKMTHTASPRISPDEARDGRQAQRTSFPKLVLEARHVTGAQLLPDRLALLDHLPKGGVAAEVGAASGGFTAEILRRTSPSKLHLVDAWASARCAGDDAILRESFAAEIAEGRVELNKGRSTDVLGSFGSETFDRVYIDTGHTYATTAEELALCAAAMKPGGLIVGHDFCTGNIVTPVLYGTIPAVNEFCVARDWHYVYLTLEYHGHFSFCITPI